MGFDVSFLHNVFRVLHIGGHSQYEGF